MNGLEGVGTKAKLVMFVRVSFTYPQMKKFHLDLDPKTKQTTGRKLLLGRVETGL